MGGPGQFFSQPVCVFSVLVCVLVVIGDDQRYSTITSPEQELYNKLGPEIRGGDFIHHHAHTASITLPYLHLPVFHHISTPAFSKEILSPVTGNKILPSVLSNILIPQESRIRVTSVNNNHGVEVFCGYSNIFVRINLDLLSFRGSPAHFRLGTCPVSRVEGRILHFHYDLSVCEGSLSIINEQLVYTNEVLYRPVIHETVIRAVPLTLPIQCVYDRFHYSYKIGFLPKHRTKSFRKTLIKKNVFTLSLRNDKWEKLGVNQSYVLGESMFFELDADIQSKDKNVYIESCHLAQSEDSNSTQRYDVISNFGCMVDSKRTGSGSQFILREGNILRFLLDAFSFAGVSCKSLYLHCTVVVGNSSASSSAKSCTYNVSENRWEELNGHDSVCKCCDSECPRPGLKESQRFEEKYMVTSETWSLINSVPTETSEWMNVWPGSVLIRHLHHPEEEEGDLEAEVEVLEKQDEEGDSVAEDEELLEEEEEVLIDTTDDDYDYEDDYEWRK